MPHPSRDRTSLLAIDTATEACSAALSVDGEIAFRFVRDARRQSELIMQMVDDLLAEAGLPLGRLDAIAFGRGPGSFTGVRIATGVAQGIAFAADLPVVPISTLAALAQRASHELDAGRILTAYDARMGEVYWGGYELADDGIVRSTIADCVSTPTEAPMPETSGWVGVGSGWGEHGPALATRAGDHLSKIDRGLLCSAREIAVLGATGYREGHALAAELVVPIYLRDRVVAVPPRHQRNQAVAS